MITHRAYPVDPWQVREVGFNPEVLAQSESVFALANGHIGLRGNLDEGDPHGLPGTYLNSFYELRPLPYAEAGYGYPESGQTLVNVTNGKLIRLLVDDEPLDLRYGKVLAHDRVLDLRAGVLRRNLEWCSPAGRTVRVRSTRMVSFTQRAIAAIRYEVEPVDAPLRVIVQSELVANEELPTPSADPRVAAVLGKPLEPEEHIARDTGGLLIHSTKRSRLRVAAAMEHLIDAPVDVVIEAAAIHDWARTTIGAVLRPGQCLRFTKLVAYGWSSQRTIPAMRDQVVAALTGARLVGWDGLSAEQRSYLDDFWDAADVVVDGDPELQQAVRFGLFHVLQGGARAEQRPIGAKGLTGAGYDGHAFWDTEMFVLPVLTYTQPETVVHPLRWRHSTMDLAQERAATLGLRGAAFPWRTIRGQECSGYWPAGTAAFHVNAGIADAVRRYVNATGDTVFEREVGLPLLVETARLWCSLGHRDRDGLFHIAGVTGPDEYSSIMDDNIYTNLMAQRNLRCAADAAERCPDGAADLGVSVDEIAVWRDAADATVIPFDEDLGIHEQAAGYIRHQMWDFDNTPPENYPLLLHYPYFDLYRKQVVKQADLTLAMHWRGDAFTAEQKARNFAYYEALTVRDSSLSSCTQAVLAAEVGQLDLAYDYLAEALLMDLEDIHHNTREGLHLASLAGGWLALVAGLGGFRDHGPVPSFAPRLPAGLDRLEFCLIWRGLRLRVEVRPDAATYSLRDGEPTDGESIDGEQGDRLELLHHGERVTVAPGAPVTMRIGAVHSSDPRPVQPAGREPARRKESA
jgi:alpha,alpha-trehalose phosphorylase